MDYPNRLEWQTRCEFLGGSIKKRWIVFRYAGRQINNWLHKYVYKRKYDGRIGCNLRQLYENGEITNESAFKEVLKHVLFDCKKNNDVGCLALQMKHGQHLADFKENLMKIIGYDKVLLQT